MNSPPKSWQRFSWPQVDTPENAASAAKNGGVAFGFIALLYAIFAFMQGTGKYSGPDGRRTRSQVRFSTSASVGKPTFRQNA